MNRIVVVCGATLAWMLVWSSAWAGVCALSPDGPVRLHDKWIEASKDAFKVPVIERDDRPMDVTFYDLDLTVASDRAEVEQGTVAITFEPVGVAMTTAEFDLASNMNVSEVRVDGTPRNHSHVADVVSVDLGQPVPAGTEITVEIDYSGSPEPSGLMGFRWSQFVDADFVRDPERPVVATLSEPDGARGWWPCHDSPYDAAPVELSITCEPSMILAAPGEKIQDEIVGGGQRQQTYFIPQPIPAYLVSFSLARFNAAWTETATVEVFDPAVTNGNYATVEIPIEYFVDDLREDDARVAWQNTVEMMSVFEDMFGPYPYSDFDPTAGVRPGKYGMAIFVSLFAMEHPTMSSMGTWATSKRINDDTGGPEVEWAVAHELFHQWFGDALRIERWGEIWLNEGMASYGEVLWDEEKYGEQAMRARLMSKFQTNYVGPVLDPAPTDVFGFTVYRKGAWVMHMLRQVMGRDQLLEAMRRYVTDPELRHARAVGTADFQRHCEDVVRDDGNFQALVNGSMDWFFVPWLEREGRPDLTID